MQLNTFEISYLWKTDHKVTFKKQITLKDGYIIPERTKVHLMFLGGESRLMAIRMPDQRIVRLRTSRGFEYFGNPFIKQPQLKTLEKWEWDGYCKTVTGHKTEPDGRGPDNSPSWMLALGLI